MEITKQSQKAAILRELPSRLLGQTAALVGKVSGEALSALGAHRYHFAVLATLQEFGAASQAELCRRTDIDRSDMNTALNALELEGAISRMVDPVNRRQNIIGLTERGNGRFDELRLRLATVQNEALGPLSVVERIALVSLLQRVHDHLASDPQT